MKYTLMHKEIPVMRIEIDNVVCAVSKIEEIYNEKHIPPGALNHKKQPDRGALNHWFLGRSIPTSRSGIREALEIMDVPMPEMLIEKCLGLSLSDQYWICPEGQNVKWSDVNFFNNDFSEDVGNALFGRQADNKILNLMSPDNTSDGYLKKKWKIIDGKRFLIKGGNGPLYQEPFNEVVASKIMEQIGIIDFVPYILFWESDVPYSICQDFIDENTEFVSAGNIIKIMKKPNHVSDYQHFINCCEFSGIPNIRESIDKMLTIDYLIANDDRHFGNFGGVRNAETLEWIGLAPLFDCGNSLWHNQPTGKINIDNANTSSRPFRKSHGEQIRLVNSFDWLDFDSLNRVDDIGRNVFDENPYMDEYRKDKICRAMKVRAEELRKYVEEAEK